MDEIIKLRIKQYAEKYETREFCKKDPSQFLYWYPINQIIDIECAAFIAAMLSFGNRTQFIKKIEYILNLADVSAGSISTWIISGYKNFPKGKEKFYRFYSYDDLRDLFYELRKIICGDCLDNFNNNKKNEIGQYFKLIYENQKEKELSEVISAAFINSKIVPKGRNSGNKRIFLFLRWMVRQNSRVDLGLWSWYPADKLIIPLDVHVINEAIKLGLLPKNTIPSKKVAIELTNILKEVYLDDPCKCDFALFGLGISED